MPSKVKILTKSVEGDNKIVISGSFLNV